MGVEYDGSAFSGWQIQPQGGVRTVQESVEQALSVVANQALRVHCAGRTDAGVHGLGQVIHFDAPVDRSMHSWVFGANANLPADVSTLWAQPVTDAFHARFSARSRCYRYVIFNRRIRPAVMARHLSWEYRPLDVQRMAQASGHLLGEHDFSSFRAYACQARHPVRTIHALTVRREGERVIIDIEANAFLHHMVRNIAGVLMSIGAGEREVGWISEVLAARDRQCGGVTAPPHGLTLVSVGYPDEFGLPAV
jgi:tRNA pseudouridine38-40 synthase